MSKSTSPLTESIPEVSSLARQLSSNLCYIFCALVLVVDPGGREEASVNLERRLSRDWAARAESVFFFLAREHLLGLN